MIKEFYYTLDNINLLSYNGNIENFYDFLYKINGFGIIDISNNRIFNNKIVYMVK